MSWGWLVTPPRRLSTGRDSFSLRYEQISSAASAASSASSDTRRWTGRVARHRNPRLGIPGPRHTSHLGSSQALSSHFVIPPAACGVPLAPHGGRMHRVAGCCRRNRLRGFDPISARIRSDPQSDLPTPPQLLTVQPSQVGIVAVSRGRVRAVIRSVPRGRVEMKVQVSRLDGTGVRQVEYKWSRGIARRSAVAIAAEPTARGLGRARASNGLGCPMSSEPGWPGMNRPAPARGCEGYLA